MRILNLLLTCFWGVVLIPSVAVPAEPVNPFRDFDREQRHRDDIFEPVKEPLLRGALIMPTTNAARVADTVHVVTTIRTNVQSKAVTTVDTFTRGGQTNLVRHTGTKAGAVRIRIHRFYRDGALLGDFVVTPDFSGFTTETDSLFALSFEFDAARHARAAVIADGDGVIVDAFTCTNGLFRPVDGSRLSEANATGKAVRQEMDKYTNP